VNVQNYDGAADDLLTAGLGWNGLQGAAPTVSDPPSAAELRRLAIYTNYRALVDVTSDGGYGRLYGPNVPLDGSAPNTTAGAGKVAGAEYIAVSRDANGRVLATFMAQVPTSFDKANPCIVTATSSGSRGVYGAVSAAGEWGLQRGCAVAYTDKGTGGAHEMDTGIVLSIDGLARTIADAGNNALFVADIAGDTRPARYAFKHAHSEQNVEKDWGLFTLQAIQFAFYAVNESFGDVVDNVRQANFAAANTVVIAAAVSNGGAASLRAAEQDADGLIDAVVVGEPQVSVNVGFPTPTFAIRRGNGAALLPNAYGKPLVHYVGVAGLFQPCAAYAASAANAPLRDVLLPQAQAEARCQSLATAGLLGNPAPVGFQAQADAAMAAMRVGGWEPESDLLHGWQFGSDTTMAVAVTYNNAYARAKAREYVCDFSFATTDPATGQVVTATPSPMSTLFALGNGIPPTRGINIVYNAAAPNPLAYRVATPDMAFQGAQCLRSLWKTRTPNPTPGSLAARLQQGADEVLATGNLRGKPAIIVHGRADALVPVNHSSRAYFGANQLAEGANSKLSYIEVTNAQHFDALLGVAGFNERFVPLHYYNIQALNTMWSHLKSATPLPGSQVLRTLPRGTGAPALAPANVPGFAPTPGPNDAITFTANTVVVPE
jgi:hydroxybutyrate-dimer hydrolase